MRLDKYPDPVQETIKVLNVKTGIPISELCTEIDKIYESTKSAVIQQLTFTTEEEKENFRWTNARSILWKHNAHRPPQFDTEVLYIGHGGERVGQRGGKPYSNLFFIVVKAGEAKLVRAMARGTSSKIFKGLGFLTKYNAKMGKYAKGDDYSIDNRTVFTQAKVKEGDIKDITYKRLNEVLKIPLIKVDDAVRYPSRKMGTSSKYTVDTDWRCVLGYFDREPRYFTRKDGTTGAVFNILDETVIGRGGIDERGNIEGGLTSWVATEHLVHDPDTRCAFYGPINVNKDKETEALVPQMNCYCIMPLWGSKMARQEDIEDR